MNCQFFKLYFKLTHNCTIWSTKNPLANQLQESMSFFGLFHNYLIENFFGLVVLTYFIEKKIKIINSE